MNIRLKSIINDISKLNPIKDEKFVLDMILDDEDNAIGVSVVDKTAETSKEVIWLEVIEESVLGVGVSPEVTDKDKSAKEFWTILYCISSNLKRKEAETWGDLETSEIAEEIYEGHRNPQNTLKDIQKTMLSRMDGDIEEILEAEYIDDPKEMPDINIDINPEELMNLVASYEDGEEVDIIVEFLNSLFAMAGEEHEFYTIDDEELEAVDEEIKASDVDIETGIAKLEKEIGLMDLAYVTHNTTSLINSFLQLEGKLDKNTIIFLNQIAHERVSIHKFLKNLISGEDINEK